MDYTKSAHTNLITKIKFFLLPYDTEIPYINPTPEYLDGKYWAEQVLAPMAVNRGNSEGDNMEKINSEWVCCPVCGNKTRDKIRKDTVLVHYPLYCPEMQTRNFNQCEKITYNCHTKSQTHRRRADELVRYFTDHRLFLFRIVFISPPQSASYKKNGVLTDCIVMP